MISKTMYRNKKMFIFKNLRTKRRWIIRIFVIFSNEILRMVCLNTKVKYFFTTLLLIHDKKYCLQVFYDKAILPPHYFRFLIRVFSVYNNVD